jgi:signal transduction histidine kinase
VTARSEPKSESGSLAGQPRPKDATVRRLRPTLRLRLTLLNGVLLVGAGAILVLLAWLLVRDALRPTDELLPGTTVVLADGRSLDAAEWQRQLVDAASGELLVKGLVALLAISVVGVAGAYAVAGRALRPLHQVTATARRLGETTMDQRIGYSGADDEVAELAKTFDAMLDRIAAAFEAQKRFVANASHELRTPLAVMRTEIDVTLSDDEADAAEYRRMATVVRDASERANGLVDALLVLARSEAQAVPAARPPHRVRPRRRHRQRPVGGTPGGGADRVAGADLAGVRAGGRRPRAARPAGR